MEDTHPKYMAALGHQPVSALPPLIKLYYFAPKVSIARDNRKGIELYSKSGKLYHERAEMRDLLRYIKTKAISREERIERMDQSRIGSCMLG